MKIAIIPARGGSKRIPRKNIKEFRGKPIIAYSIEAALESACFDHVVVSTDDEEIAEVARRYGAELPFMRPPELSGDHTPTIPVIRHAIRWAESEAELPDAVCCIYATAPFVTADDLKNGLRILQEKPDTDFAFSATRFDFPIQRAIGLNDDGTTRMFQPEHELTRSQDLPAAYHDAGLFYWGTREAWLNQKGVFSARSRIILLPKDRVQDIDTMEDWERANTLFQMMARTNS